MSSACTSTNRSPTLTATCSRRPFWPSISWTMRSSWSFSGPAGATRRRARCTAGFEPAAVDRLQQVVDRVDLERLDGVLVEGGDENDA